MVRKILSEVIVHGKPLIPLLKNGSKEKVALVVTGGGMQGCRSGGMVCGLEELGMRTRFNAVYAVSSGAANAIYFLSGKAASAAHLYYKHIVRDEFASIIRWPIVNLDYVIGLMTNQMPISIDEMKKSGCTLKITATNKHGEGEFFTVEDEIPAEVAMKVTMSIGFWAGKGVLWKGEKYYDGMVAEPIPYKKVIEDGYRNILVLLNMPLKWNDKEDNIFLKTIKKPWLNKEHPKFKKAYLLRQRRYRQQLHEILAGKFDGKINITVIAPSDACTNLPFYTKNQKIIEKAIDEGIGIIGEAFNVPMQIKIS